MSTHPICIDSPFFRVPPPFYSLKPEQDPLPENNESYVFPFGATSPEILPPAFQPSSSAPMTPWSALLHSQLRQKPAELTLPFLFAGEQCAEGIEERITFSQGEEECCLLTPIKQHNAGMEQELSSLQMLTTCRRPSFQPLQMSRGCRALKMGLKKLTQQAYYIVNTLHNVTYKDVADRLVREVQFEEQGFDQPECQEQNIKRRVYDALNVMIAVGLLKKDGRKVTTGRLKGRRNHAKLDNQEVEVGGLAQLVNKQEAKLKDKRRRLIEAERKLEAVRYLLAKNMSSLPNKQEIVSFPFIGVSACSQLHIAHHTPQQLVIVTTNQQQLHPFGDIDSLQWLKQHSSNRHTSFP